MADIACMKLDLSRPRFKKLAIAGTLAVAFLFMASIFVPGRLQAGDGEGVQTPPVLSSEILDKLVPLGQIESDRYVVKFFATPNDPLYSVHDPDGRPLAEHLTPAQIAQHYPDLILPDAHADVSMEIMGTDVGGANW